MVTLMAVVCDGEGYGRSQISRALRHTRGVRGDQVGTSCLPSASLSRDPRLRTAIGLFSVQLFIGRGLEFIVMWNLIILVPESEKTLGTHPYFFAHLCFVHFNTM